MNQFQHLDHRAGWIGDRELHRADDGLRVEQQAQPLESVHPGGAKGRQQETARRRAGAIVIPLGSGVPGELAFALGNVVFARGVVVLSIITRTYRQVASPPQLLSRVMATVRFVSWGAIPVGGLIGGGLADALAPRTTLLAFAAASLCVPLAVTLSPVRRLRDLTDWKAGDTRHSGDRPRQTSPRPGCLP